MNKEQREILESLLRRRKTPVGVAKPARAILLLAEGEQFSQTAERVGLGERHLRTWARRFIEQGVEGLQDRARPGRVPGFPPQVAWFSRQHLCLYGAPNFAQAQMIPPRFHLCLSPKVPRDKAFVKPIREISRLYTRQLKSHEMVLCLDEKTALQPRPCQSSNLTT